MTTKDKIIEKQKELIAIYKLSVDYDSPYKQDIESEIASLESELAKEQEPETSVFLIERDGNTSKLYKNGKRVSPEEFTVTYGCEMTDEQKKILEVVKKQYIDSLSQEPEGVTADQILKGCEHDGSYIPVSEVKRLMQSYHEAKLKEITDSDIEAWVELVSEKKQYAFRLGLKKGAEAYRDNEIKHIK
jgi:hypothetical protein